MISSVQAKSYIGLPSVITRQPEAKCKQQANNVTRVRNWDFTGLSVFCPDGAEMYAGMVGIRTDANGNIIDVRIEWWGPQVACEDHHSVYVW